MKRKNGNRGGFGLPVYIIFTLLTIFTLVICTCIGSVNLPFSDTLKVFINLITRSPQDDVKFAANIILPVRLPRVVCASLVGASLSICGAAMQGLLKNTLADGSTFGVSSGASLGAILALAFGISLPGFPGSATTGMAILFAFLSLILILGLAYKLDSSLSTNTIILLGVIFSMFVSSISSLVITFAGERVKAITFWSMGSLQDTDLTNALMLLVTLVICGGILLCNAQELNAFAIGEDNARNIGVNVRRVKLTVLISISILIGVSVSISGSIGFVGLVTPHILRSIVGPNHKRLLPASLFGGAIFLMLSDLAARIIAKPRELPIGVVTSIIGTVVFIYIFYKNRK